jgi:hypothetical protein
MINFEEKGDFKEWFMMQVISWECIIQRLKYQLDFIMIIWKI